MSTTSRTIKGLGEASLSVRDLDAMHDFYAEVLGLEVLRREGDYVFFKIAEGYGGHTQNFALFAAHEVTFLSDKLPEIDSQRSTLHHIAFNIDLADYDSERQRLEALGLKVEAVDHDWIKVRSLYFPDPEGNTIELVAYDPSLG